MVRVLTPNLLNYKGGDTPRTKVSNAVYTSTELPPHVKIPMHHEMSYSNTYPSFIYFCCIKPAEEGGETPLLDSRELYKLLSKDLIDRFKTNRLAYITNLHEKFGLGKTWSEYFEVESKEILNKFLEEKKVEHTWKKGNILSFKEIVQPIMKHPVTHEFVFFSQADQWHPSHLSVEDYMDLLEFMDEEDFYHNCKYGDGVAIDTKDLDEIRSCTNRLLKKFLWRRGDFLIVDNLLVMHGRMPFSGTRKILVAMG